MQKNWLQYLSCATILGTILVVTSGCNSGEAETAKTDSPVPANTQANTSNDAEPNTYAAIKHILDENCIGCHGAKNARDGIRLHTYQDAMTKPGVIVAGDSAGSALIQYTNGSKNPRMPMGKPPLSDDDVALLAAWIDAGAKE